METDSTVDKYLNRVYYDPSNHGSFSGIEKLWFAILKDKNRPVGLTKSVLKKWLRAQDTYSVYKLSRRNFPRERIIVSKRDMQWDADLMDMTKLKSDNDQNSFVLVVIDLLSRFAWLRVIRNKTGAAVSQAFEDIFAKDGRVPDRVRTDLGKEFYNKEVSQMFEKRNVHHFSSYSDKKANYAERLIRTVKGRLAKFMYDRQTFRYVDIIQQVADSYNGTVHSAIKVPPSSVTATNDLDLYVKLYMPLVNSQAKQPYSHSFKVGDAVRISLNKGPFAKAYNENFSEAVYKIKFLVPSHPPRYEIVDLLGKKLRGSFYEEELEKVDFNPERSYKIDSIIAKKGNKVLVRWYGYDKRFDSWIPAKEVKKYESALSKK
jgi:hypothetical protein